MKVLVRDFAVGWAVGFVVALLWYAVEGRHGESITTWGGAVLIGVTFGIATGLLWSARSAARRFLDERVRPERERTSSGALDARVWAGGLAVLLVLTAGFLLALLL